MDIERYRRSLLQERTELLEQDARSAAERAPVVLDQESVGRLSRIDAIQVQAMAQAQARIRHKRRAAINAALDRIEQGEFGWCLSCGEEIAAGRLDNDPAATLCIDCARGG